MRWMSVLKFSFVEDCGCFVQQPLTPADVEQNATETDRFGPALSHTSGAPSFAGTMLLAASQTSYSLKCISYSSINGTTLPVMHSRSLKYHSIPYYPRPLSFLTPLLTPIHSFLPHPNALVVKDSPSQAPPRDIVGDSLSR